MVKPSCKKCEENMESKYSYRFTKHAKVDLDNALEYMIYLKAASDFRDKPEEKIEEARLFPENGVVSDDAYLPEIGITQKLTDNYMMNDLVAEE